MSTNRERAYREAQCGKQGSRCYYCPFPMWADCGNDFAKAHGISNAEATRFQCATEHPIARCDGGTSCQTNTVAARKFCNQHRHRRVRQMSPERFMAHVRRRLGRGSWHPRRLHHIARSADDLGDHRSDISQRLAAAAPGVGDVGWPSPAKCQGFPQDRFFAVSGKSPFAGGGF